MVTFPQEGQLNFTSFGLDKGMPQDVHLVISSGMIQPRFFPFIRSPHLSLSDSALKYFYHFPDGVLGYFMDRAIPITKDVHWIGVNDRETHLFEALWPLPFGVSYNSYLIVDEKVAIMDTVKFTSTGEYLAKIRSVLGNRKVDYLIINHMEPDHSGSIRGLMEVFPEMVLVGNKKTAEFLNNFYGIQERIHIVGQGDVLDLGAHQLEFHITPMVHWPETMMTYDRKDRILFSGDAFGGFGTLDGSIFDDELNIKFFVDEISRYYTNIVAKFSPMVQSALKKLSGLDVAIIAATHGPVWRSNPHFIIDYYDRLSRQETEEGVVVIYGSMYGNTKKMAEAVARGISEGGIPKIRIYDASKTHLSYLINDVWRYKGIVLGSCTYNAGLFPPIQQLVHFMEKAKMKNHVIGVFGSYSWSGEGIKELETFGRGTACKFVDPPVPALAGPKEKDLEALVDLGRKVAQEVLKCKDKDQE